MLTNENVFKEILDPYTYTTMLELTFHDITDYLYHTRNVDILSHIIKAEDPFDKAFLYTITSIKYRWDWIDHEKRVNILSLISNTNDRPSLQALRTYLENHGWNISSITYLIK